MSDDPAGQAGTGPQNTGTGTGSGCHTHMVVHVDSAHGADSQNGTRARPVSFVYLPDLSFCYINLCGIEMG